MSIPPVVVKFQLGTVVATPGAQEAFQVAGVLFAPYLQRHATGDWGEVSADDKRLNDVALRTGDRLLSAYTLPGGTRVWIITEADRSATTFLLPGEY